jgi:ABC-type Fe3+-hydroxamate transport system substrate-binding protein
LAALALAACAGSLPSAGPLVLVDDAGHRTALPSPAVRIVSLVPATTEALFALGAGGAVVGRTRWCDYPAEAAAVTNVGDGMQPNVEAILALDPDLVVAYRSPGNRAAVDRLRQLGIPTLELATDLLADLARAIRLLARATGRAPAGDSLNAAIEADLARVTVRRGNPPTVFVLTWSQPAITLGAGSFLSEIIERAGARNAFADEPRPSFVVSVEAVAARDPDYVLLSGEGEPGWAERPEWRVVEAVRERRFLAVHGSEYNRPSPRAARAVARLSQLLPPR